MEHFFEKQYKIEFEKFINNSKEYFKLNNLSEGIVSFSLIIDNYNFNNYLDEIIKQFSPSFYLHKPYQNFSILSIGSIKNIFENGQGRFAKVDKNLKSLSNSIYYNWDESDFNKIPLWVGGMKFTVEHDDNIWTDFNDTFWFIPQISFVYENNRTLLIYNINFNIKKNIEKVINDFEQILSNLIKFKKENNENEISNGTNDFSKILKVEGNSLKDKKKFITKVKTLIDEIENGSIEKVVISRYLDILLSNPPTINYLIKKLMKKNF
jgi:isochorismate synthase EntC